MGDEIRQKMGAKKTIIFDMDGVLVDSEPFHCKAWILAYSELGIEIDEKYYYSRICGKHGSLSTALVLQDFNVQADSDALIRRKANLVGSIVQGKVSAISGSCRLIEFLYTQNYTLGLASSSSFMGVDSILRTIDLKKYFQIIHAGEAIKNGKPHPDIYLKTAKMLDVSPEECVVIEDSSSGVLAATRAGMKVIGILNGRNSTSDLEFADKIVHGFDEITLELIEQL